MTCYGGHYQPKGVFGRFIAWLGVAINRAYQDDIERVGYTVVASRLVDGERKPFRVYAARARNVAQAVAYMEDVARQMKMVEVWPHAIYEGFVIEKEIEIA